MLYVVITSVAIYVECVALRRSVRAAAAVCRVEQEHARFGEELSRMERDS